MMRDLKFRALRADEVEVRAAQVSQKGASFLLYKDARVDQIILDETVGPLNWQRSHSRDNANCTVSIWDYEKLQWVSKEDTGTESNTEKEKGLASDSFKRACFNWGIGRELYTAPRIWIGPRDITIKENGRGGYTTYDKLKVHEMAVAGGRIIKLSLINTTTGNMVYRWQAADTGENSRHPKENTPTDEKPQEAPEIDEKQAYISEKELIVLERMWAKAWNEGKVKSRFETAFPQAPNVTKELYAKAMQKIAGFGD